MYDTYKQWFDEDIHFTSKKDLEKAAKQMTESQFDLKNKIDEIIESEKPDFRTIHPEDFEKMCEECKNR